MNKPQIVSPLCSLRQTVFKMFENKETGSDEFKAMLELFGREKMERFWKEFVEEKKGQRDGAKKPREDGS